MNEKTYVHGYSNRESTRLSDQAVTLNDILHNGTIYPPGSKVLESGCGIGAQTVILAKNSPEASITSIDISQESINTAKAFVEKSGFSNVDFHVADIFNLNFQDEAFDHIFVCFVLEHLSDPVRALNCLMRVLKKGGSITVIEGDHGSTYFHPHSDEAMRAIQCQIAIQARMKGNSLIGRQLYPLLRSACFSNIEVSPKVIYVDGNSPTLIDGFTKKTFIAMIEGVKEQALELGLIDEKTWDKGLNDLYKTATPEGTFCYTFFKGTAIRE